MHYIVGTQIKANNLHPLAQSSSKLRSVGAVQLRRKVISDHFLPGEVYSLYYIKKTEDGKLNYTFLNSGTDQKFDIIFETAKAADIYLAKVMGDQLPDYEKFYDKNAR